MRGAGRERDKLIIEELTELARDELARVISVWSEPMTAVGSARARLSKAVRLETNARIQAGASDFFFRKYAVLKREWSSTNTSMYRDPPRFDPLNGPAMSA